MNSTMTISAECVYHSSKSCIGTLLSPSLTPKSSLSHFKCQLIDGNVVFLSAFTQTSSGQINNRLFVNGLLANQLGIRETNQMNLTEESAVADCSKLWLSPLSVDDYEILDLNQERVEEILLDQLRLVCKNFTFPLWIDSVCLFLHVDSFEPADAECVQLSNATEVFVSPNVNKEDLTTKSVQKPTRSQLETTADSFSSKLTGWFYDSTNKSTKAAIVSQLQSQLNLETNCDGIWPLKLRVQPICSELEEFQSDQQCCCANSLSSPWCCCLRSQPSTAFVWDSDVPSLGCQKSILVDLMVKVKRDVPADPTDKPELKKTTTEVVGFPVRLFFVKESGNKSLTNECQNCSRWMKAMGRKLLRGHVLLHNNLRRQFGIAKFSYVQFDGWKDKEFVPIPSLKIFPSQQLPQDLDIKLSFTRSLCSQWPLVLFSGSLLSITSDVEEYEAIVTVIDDKSSNFTLLSPDSLPFVKVEVKFGSLPVSLITKPHAKTSEFDFTPIGRSRRSYQSVDELITECLEFVKLKLGVSPLSRKLGDVHGHLLLTGAIGCGKTSIGESLCWESANWPIYAFSLKIDCAKLKGKKPENLAKLLWDPIFKASEFQPSVILMDDLDVLCCNPSSMEQLIPGADLTYTGITKVVVEYLEQIRLKKWRIMVIATARSTKAINEQLHGTNKSFFSLIKELESPDQACRQLILTEQLSRCRSISENQLDLNEIAKLTEGFVAADLTRLVKITFNTTAGGDDLTTENFHSALKGFKTLNLHNVHLLKPNDFQCVEWKRVGGLVDCKRVIQEVLLWPSKYPQLFRQCPIRLAQGILLYGYPGTGKTMLAGAAAKECGLNFIVVKGPELLSKYIGASEQGVRDTFQRAKTAKPCLLFFDEFDALAPRRGHDSTGVTDRVVNQLLTELDGVEGLEGVFIMAATSRPDLIDAALLRPGRIDKSLRCDLPDEMERLEILKSLSFEMQLDDDVKLDFVATVTEQFSGADLKALLHNAQLEAVHEYLSVVKQQGIVSSGEGNKWTSDILAYFPTLAEGLTTDLSEETRLMLTEKLNAVFVSRKSFESPNQSSVAEKSGVKVSQAHINSALKTTRVSLSAVELERFKQSFGNFERYRKGDTQSLIDSIGTKATLA